MKRGAAELHEAGVANNNRQEGCSREMHQQGGVVEEINLQLIRE